MDMTRYAKAWMGVLGAAVSAVVAAIDASGGGNLDWVNVALLAAGAINVAMTANLPGYRTAKAIVATVIAALTIAADLIATGGDWSHWPQMLVAALTAAGVYAVPNRFQPRHAEPEV